MCNVMLLNWSYANYSVKILKSEPEHFPTGRFDVAGQVARRETKSKNFAKPTVPLLVAMRNRS
jgi:hypothetical protein